ncbi:hypothetical protein GCM10022267_90420 [Lentzea roselyniae]|uniref:Ricin-type beta-trefoil lectin domain-containing protein n=1 Tax=Lentzea roselyniae TaxID=531940 RepID=A0ABP7CKQ2_9PSEU
MTFRGILLRLAGSVTAVALVFTAAPAVATAAPQAESLYWIRFAAGVQRCLDANLEGSVYTHACQDRNTYQQWDNYALGKFRHKRTGLCLAARCAVGVPRVLLGQCQRLDDVVDDEQVHHEQVDGSLPGQRRRPSGGCRTAGLPGGNRIVDHDEADGLTGRWAVREDGPPSTPL